MPVFIFLFVGLPLVVLSCQLCSSDIIVVLLFLLFFFTFSGYKAISYSRIKEIREICRWCQLTVLQFRMLQKQFMFGRNHTLNFETLSLLEIYSAFLGYPQEPVSVRWEPGRQPGSAVRFRAWVCSKNFPEQCFSLPWVCEHITPQTPWSVMGSVRKEPLILTHSSHLSSMILLVWERWV